MDDKIINELKEIVDKFDNGEYVLNTERINNTETASHNFIDAFCTSMHEFKLAVKPIQTKYDEAHPLGYSLRKKQYEEKCEAFHQTVTIAKTLDLFKNKHNLDEIEKLKNKCSDLESKLKDAESKIQVLNEEKGFLKGKLSIYERDTPKSDTLESDVTK